MMRGAKAISPKVSATKWVGNEGCAVEASRLLMALSSWTMEESSKREKTTRKRKSCTLVLLHLRIALRRHAQRERERESALKEGVMWGD